MSKNIKPPEPGCKVLSLPQLALRWGCSVNTIYKQSSAGTLPVRVKKPVGSRPIVFIADVEKYESSL